MNPAAPDLHERTRERVFEHRARSLLVSLRQLRHDLASPLSGAALHLEMASRRLAQRADPELERLAENVRTSQQEVAWAGALLDLVGDLARSAEDVLSPFPFEEAVRDGVARQSARASRDGVALRVEGRAGATLLGARDRLAQAVADLTGHAVARAARGEPVEWRLEEGPEAAEATVAWRAAPEERAERAFVLVRRQPAEAPATALFLARWVVDGLGGSLTVEVEGERLRARMRFPAAPGEETR